MKARLWAAVIAIAVGLALTTATASAQTVSFGSPSFVAAGFESGGVAIADFNGDGTPDIAVADPAGSVTVFVTNGHGGYEANGPFTVAGQPLSIAVADLNGDGMPDIITADSLGTTVSVLMNTTTKGAGTVSFATHRESTVGSDPSAIAIGDFNGDGKPDIAAANFGSSNVSVLLNTTTKGSSTASFATAVSPTVQPRPVAIAVGDLNGDGKPDIVTAANFGADTLSVLLNNASKGAATPSFATPSQTITINKLPTQLAIADLNGDGKPDIAFGTNSIPAALGVLVNTTPVDASTVTTASEQDLPVANGASSGIAIADINGDGRPDIVDTSNGGKTSVLVNTTSAGASSLSFDAHQDFSSIPGTLNSLAVGDLNGDGRPDIVTSTGSNVTDNVAIVLNQTASLATSAPASGTVGTAFSDTATLRAGTLSGGSITFKAYGPNDATCSAAPAFTGAPVSVIGSGSYRSRAFTPAKAGTYRWIASYSGDANDAATATACGEPVTVALPAVPHDTAAPQIKGKPKKGTTLTCGRGTWSGTPTGYTYRWSRDGTPVIGATHATYKVQTADEGSKLTCTVTATNPGGTGTATTKAVKVPVPFVLHCPAPSGKLSGTTLGRLRLGMTATQAHRAYPDSSARHQRYLDFFCLTPFGVRVGFASPRILKTLPASERGAYSGHVIWASTSSPVYDVRGVRPGATLANARKDLPGGNLLRVGKNDWYLAPAGAATAVLKVRRGVVQEIGIGDRSLTRTRSAQFVFMTSFA